MKYRLKKTSLFTKLLCLYFLALILGAMNIGSFGSLLKVLAMSISIYGLIGLKLNKAYVPITFKTVFIYALIVTFSLAYSRAFSWTVTNSISQMSFMLFIFVVCQRKYNDDELFFLKKSLIWASRISAVVVITFAQINWNGRLFLKGVITENENYLPAYFVAGFVYSIQNLSSNSNLIRKVFSIGELGFYVYLVLALGSRGGLIALVASGIVAFSYLGYGVRGNVKTIVTKILSIVIIFALIAVIIRYVNPMMLNRFMISEIQASKGTERLEIWSTSISYWWYSNPLRWLIGFGSGSTMPVLQSIGFAHANVMHNCFIESLFELGIIGFYSYTYMIYIFCKTAFREKDSFAFSVIVGMIGLSLSSSINTFKPYWNIMIFIICLSRSVKLSNNIIVGVKER